MARNKEKQFGKLNRLYLENERADKLKLNPVRPSLASLQTAEEIKQWLPSIKKDIDFNLKQTEVICYSDTKIEEYQSEVNRLEKEYKRFVTKLKQLDSEIEDIPWTERPYKSKRMKISDESDIKGQFRSSSLERITTPITEKYEDVLQPTNSGIRIEGDDKPLQFTSLPVITKLEQNNVSNIQINLNEEAVQETESKLKKIFGLT